MSQADVPLPVERLHGMGIVVSDIRESMEQFSRFFGISEWRLAECKTGRDFSITVGGSSIDASLFRATGANHHVKFDLIQPLSGSTVFGAYLTERGPGAHDLTTNVMTPEAFALVQPRLRREGIQIAQTLRFGNIFELHYLHTAPQLGTVAKILVPLQPSGDPRVMEELGELVRIDPGSQDTRLPMDRPYHVCVVTQHRRLSVHEAFRRIFGINNWFEYDNESGVTASDAHYRGAPAESRFRLILGRRENFAVEVVEMIYGRNVYQDMLDTKGEGIHHLMTTICETTQLEKVKRSLKTEGYEIVQDGAAGPIYYGYLAGEGKIANLAVEMLCPLADDWMESQDKNFWAILKGEQYS